LEPTENASKKSRLSGRPSNPLPPKCCTAKQALYSTGLLSTGDCTKLSRQQRWMIRAGGAEGIQRCTAALESNKWFKPPDAKINFDHRLQNILFYNKLDTLGSCHDIHKHNKFYVRTLCCHFLDILYMNYLTDGTQKKERKVFQALHVNTHIAYSVIRCY